MKRIVSVAAIIASLTAPATAIPLLNPAQLNPGQKFEVFNVSAEQRAAVKQKRKEARQTRKALRKDFRKAKIEHRKAKRKARLEKRKAKIDDKLQKL